MDLPRQPQPVTLTFEGEFDDVEYYIKRILRYFGNGANGLDDAVRNGNKLTIYPAAVND